MSGPADREVARFLAAVRNGHSDRAIKMTSFELADALTDEGYGNRRGDRVLLIEILRKGAATVKRDGDV